MKKFLLIGLLVSTNAFATDVIKDDYWAGSYRTSTFSEIMNPRGNLVKIEVPIADFKTKPGMARVRIDVFDLKGVGLGSRPLRVYNTMIASVVVNNELVDDFNYSKPVIYIDVKPGKQNIGVYQTVGNNIFTGKFFVNKGDGFEYEFEEGKSYSMTFSRQEFGVYKLTVNDILKIEQQ
ncbi:MAG: hypothetical protein EBS86_04095 [Crocinitomicaceae bacterium]|nr:hypothetical protein [Crocinitomicaceae bacterium]